MRPPLIQRPQRCAPYRTRERGVTMALVALAMVAIIAMAGLSIDIGTLYQASAEAQRAADAGALAAARTISMQGLTGDPTNASSSWQQICGGAGTPATMAAQTAAQQNTVGGVTLAVSSIMVNYGTDAGGSGSNADCSTLGSAFGVNPIVTVQVQQANLPTYFSRIWGRTGNTVGATATAEVFNPSNSATYAGGMVPVQPRCVKPWIVPNLDPNHTIGCATGCTAFLDLGTGSIETPGIYTSAGVIGERFWLMPDCQVPGTGSACVFRSTPPQANYTKGGTGGTDPTAPPTPNLEYLPGQVPSISSAFTAIPSCSSSASTYAQAIAACDQSTQYQCGVQSSSASPPNQVDLSENPGLTDTTTGVQCLIHQTTNSTTVLSGQDALLPTGGTVGSLPPNYPFQIEVGASNPLNGAGLTTGIITSSNNIVSLPIYDSSAGTVFAAGTTTPVTIVGFLQVFINVVDANGNAYVTVLNVSGCGNTVGSGTLYLNGTSPVPIRLITPIPSS
jgi:Flp pilus assembly protein TadG